MENSSLIMTLISLLTVFLFAALGFTFPRFMGWLVLAIMPIGSGIIGLTIIPSTTLPLRITQAEFSIAFGILMSKNNLNLFLSFLSRSRVSQFLLLFISLSCITALQNSDTVFWKHFLLYYSPAIIAPLIVSFLTITNEQDFNRLIEIFVWSSAVIGLLCIIELLTFVNINRELYLATSPTINYDELPLAAYRGEFLRPAGPEGDPISTGIKLAFFFPFTLWYFSKNKLIGWLPCILTIIGIFVCQSRAVVISILLSMLFIMTKSRFMTKWILAISLIAILLVINVPLFSDYVGSFISERFISETIVPLMAGDGPTEDVRVISIPLSIDYFLNSPIFGHGSSIYSYEVLMDYGDLPAPLLYLVSGGLLLFLPYMSFLFGMVMSVSKVLKKTLIKAAATHRIILLFLAFAFLNGIFPLFFNTTEKHMSTMIMAYAAFFRVFMTQKYIFKLRKYTEPAKQNYAGV
jgi:hypothetical protein